MQGKKPSHRNAIIRSQILELIRAERLQTTPQKGKLLKQRFDRLVTEAKKGTDASKRNIENFLRNEKAVAKLYKILPRLEEDNSGYVLSARTLPRKGDNAPQMICMIKGHEIQERKSRLATVLDRQGADSKSAKRGGGRIRRNTEKVSTSASAAGKKVDSTADTRRVST